MILLTFTVAAEWAEMDGNEGGMMKVGGETRGGEMTDSRGRIGLDEWRGDGDGVQNGRLTGAVCGH